MKKNFKTWLVVVISVIAAITFFVAAGIYFSKPLEGGEVIPPYVRIVACSLLCLAGLAAMFVSYTHIYQSGKGKNINPKDLRMELYEFISQWTATDKKKYAVVQDGKSRQWMVFLPSELKNIKAGNFVKPWKINIQWTLVPADFYPKPEEKPVEKKTEPVVSIKRIQSIPETETSSSTPSDQKRDGDGKKG